MYDRTAYDTNKNLTIEYYIPENLREHLPNFAKSIIETFCISDEQKHRFCNEFLYYRLFYSSKDDQVYR